MDCMVSSLLRVEAGMSTWVKQIKLSWISARWGCLIALALQKVRFMVSVEIVSTEWALCICDSNHTQHVCRAAVTINWCTPEL